MNLNALNDYGIPLHACNGYRQDAHYWELLGHIGSLKHDAHWWAAVEHLIERRKTYLRLNSESATAERHGSSAIRLRRRPAHAK